MALDSTAASIMKSGLDLRPKPPPSRVTLTFTSAACIPRRLAMRSRAACGDWMQPHAPHLERLRGVVLRDLAAVDRRARHDRVEHAGEPRVDAVLGLAAHDVGSVEQLQVALADVAEARRILQLHRVP